MQHLDERGTQGSAEVEFPEALLVGERTDLDHATPDV